jgi:aminomethyltransferase
MTDPDPSLRHSPLDAEHRALGAKLVEFGGWEMPIQYVGVLEEHRACRSDSVVFDVSHLGSLRVAGADAHALLQRALTNDLDRIGPGRAQYTHLLDPDDAHVTDDIIVWWVTPEEFLVMPNASNTERITGALTEVATGAGLAAVEIADITATRAVLAVQGPQARARLATVDPALATVERFGVAPVRWEDVDCVVAGTGYTGEDGVEIHVPAADAPALWRAIVGAGITPAGLGARDTLRLEAGLPLHGHELGEGITPLQAGLGWVVRWDKGDFRGRDPLAAERERGVARRLRGLLVDGRRPPRAGNPVVVDGVAVGEVTSGNFSPVLGQAIALAFLPPETADGAEVTVDVRGHALAATVTKPPFVTSS